MVVTDQGLTKEKHEKLCAGDDQAWEDFYTQHKVFIRNLIRNKYPVFNQTDAEEVLNDTMLGIVKGIHTWKELDKYEVYIRVICKNKCFDYWKRSKKHHEGVIPFEDPNGLEVKTENMLGYVPGDNASEKVAKSEMRHEVRSFFKKKFKKEYPECEKLIRLRIFDDLKYKEISQALNINIQTVGIRLNRCLEHFEKLWKEKNEQLL